MKAYDADISEESQRELALDVLKQAAHRELAAGVLKQAAQDLRRFHGATSKVERELYLDAYRWLTVGECASPFSFLNVCRLLNRTPQELRQELVGELSFRSFCQWTRRCSRVVRRFSDSLIQVSQLEYNLSTTPPLG